MENKESKEEKSSKCECCDKEIKQNDLADHKLTKMYSRFLIKKEKEEAKKNMKVLNDASRKKIKALNDENQRLILKIKHTLEDGIYKISSCVSKKHCKICSIYYSIDDDHNSSKLHNENEKKSAREYVKKYQEKNPTRHCDYCNKDVKNYSLHKKSVAHKEARREKK